MSRLLETWCLMEYAEKGSLADALRTGRLKRPNGLPELGVIIACLQDIASGVLSESAELPDLQTKHMIFAACRRFSVLLSSPYRPVLACHL